MSLDKLYIKNIIQNILNREFKSAKKRNILDYIDRFNFACPICMDSAKNLNAKRCNIYLNKLRVVCFNCGYKSNFEFFIKKFNQQLDVDKKLEMIEHLDSVVSYKDYEDAVVETTLDNLLKLEEVTEFFNSGDCSITDFSPIISGSKAYKYLIARSIVPEMHHSIYQAKYWYNEDRYDDVICILNRKGSYLLGMQIRNLKDGKMRMFKIYNYETLYKLVKGVDNLEDIDIDNIVTYNKLSYYYNILNVDFSYPVTVFEGYLDSLFYPNSIGVVGTNTDFRFLENNNLELKYFFDNDYAGWKKSEEKIKSGYPVFLWKKLFEHIINNKKSEDPYKLSHRINKVKDLNKLAQLVENPFKKLNLEKFFSVDQMDISYIPKFKRKRLVVD